MTNARPQPPRRHGARLDRPLRRRRPGAARGAACEAAPGVRPEGARPPARRPPLRLRPLPDPPARPRRDRRARDLAADARRSCATASPPARCSRSGSPPSSASTWRSARSASWAGSTASSSRATAGASPRRRRCGGSSRTPSGATPHSCSARSSRSRRRVLLAAMLAWRRQAIRGRARTPVHERDPELEGFLAVLAARRAPRTVEAYRRDLTHIGARLGKPVSAATTDELQHLPRRSSAPTGSRRRRSPAASPPPRSFFAHQVLLGARTDNPAAELELAAAAAEAPAHPLGRARRSG